MPSYRGQPECGSEEGAEQGPLKYSLRGPRQIGEAGKNITTLFHFMKASAGSKQTDAFKP